ncbi:MAG TPA: 3-phosphoshikimate 1-carboxyvinyltransferase [Blastocatellia bacterium]|nr:3-phosphoshikimate 1-carboxyvinyltransferase [Blastocatellia bacterium]
MSRSMRIKGRSRIRGELWVPGDKSISHRVAMLASIAEGASRVTGFSTSIDCQTTLDCIERLGIRIERRPGELIIHGQGLFSFRPERVPVTLQAGNSGSTIRMLSGLLAAQRFESEIDGDASLRRRPMTRIIEPLELMGARIEAANLQYAPLRIRGQQLNGISYASRVASAQVKSCVLFAGLLARGRTTFSEPSPSRNHTELMLGEFGAQIEAANANAWTVEGGGQLHPVDYQVPGDVSSAAFFIAAATALGNSEIALRGIGLNPTRTAFLDILTELGANVARQNISERHREAVGDLHATTSELRASGKTTLAGSVIANLIDEVPILAVLATQVAGRVEVRDALELRVKESDRIRTIVDGIRSLGGEIEEFEDGFSINGPQRLRGGKVESAGDHRIAMAFAIAGLLAEGTTEILDADCASVSFPGFYEALASVTEAGAVEPYD